MTTLLLILAGTALAFWAAFRFARWLPRAAAGLAALLLIPAWYLSGLDTKPGEGAAAGVAVFIVGVWMLEAMCILLAGTLLVTGWRFHNEPLAKTLLLFLFLPFVAYTAFLVPNRGHSAAASPARPAGAAALQRGTKMDGYVWAIDSQLLSDGECRNAEADFIAGCKEGVAKNRARPAR